MHFDEKIKLNKHVINSVNCVLIYFRLIETLQIM